MSEKITMRAVAFEDAGTWVVQGIEYDIVVNAQDVGAALERFKRAILDRCALAEMKGRTFSDGLRPAADIFRDMYEEADYELKAAKRAKRFSQVDVRVGRKPPQALAA